MEMRTLKLLEFAAIFGVLAWFWFSQRSATGRPKEADKDAGTAKLTDAAPEQDDKPVV